MPVYNCEQTLSDCVGGILSQKGALELLLIDDGSTDGSRAMADCLAASDTRVRVVHQKNGGVSSARNTGLSLARGAWVCFVDGDDLFAPNALSALEAAAQSSPDMVLFSWTAFSDGENPFSKPIDAAPMPRTLEKDEILLLRRNTMYRSDYVDTTKLGFTYSRGIWGCLLKKSIIRDHALAFAQGVTMGEDAAFRLSYLRYCESVVTLDAVLYGYRQSGASITHKMNQRIADVIGRTVRCFADVVEKHYAGDSEMTRRLYADMIFESQWLFLLNLKHPDCRLPLAAREEALTALLQGDPMQKAVKGCDRSLLLPPLDRLLDAYRLTDISARYRAASDAMNQGGFKTTVKAFLNKLGILKKFEYWYRAARQKQRDARK